MASSFYLCAGVTTILPLSDGENKSRYSEYLRHG